MNPLESPLLCLAAAAASIAAAATTATLDPRPWHDRALAGLAPSLACRLEPGAAPGTVLRLTNTGAQPLAQGTRYAWVTLGTPASQGELRALPRSLLPGEQLAVQSDLRAHGAGCAAVLADASGATG
jgi:hypothetical protein